MSGAVTSVSSSNGIEQVSATGHRQHPVYRLPRARLLINGTERTDTVLEAYELERSRFSRADTASITLAVDRSVLGSAATPYWFDPAAPSGSTIPPDIDIQIQMRDEAISGSQWETMFQGIVDHVQWSPLATSMEIQCRDYMAKLLDMRVQQAWLNLTGAELVTTVIKAAGLTPSVSFPAGLTGQFWQIEHKRTSSAGQHRFQTAYDLCRYIANVAQCDLYADGKTVYCVPYPTAGDGTLITSLTYKDTGYPTPISSDVMNLQLERDFLVAKGVMVHVMAWDSRQRTKNEIYWSAQGKSRTAADNAGTLYTFRAQPGSKQDEVEALAKSKYDEIVAHNRTIRFSRPGSISLEPRQFYSLTGTETSFDQTYSVESVATRYSTNDGFLQDVLIRNRTASSAEGTTDDLP